MCRKLMALTLIALGLLSPAAHAESATYPDDPAFAEAWSFAREVAMLDLGSPVRGVAVSPDGNWILAGLTDGTARLLELHVGVAGGELVEAWTLRGHEGDVTSVAFSPDGNWALTASADSTARLWWLDPDGLPEPYCMATLRGHGDEVHQAVLTPDDSWVISGSKDGTLRLWRLPFAGESILIGGDPIDWRAARDIPGDMPALDTVVEWSSQDDGWVAELTITNTGADAALLIGQLESHPDLFGGTPLPIHFGSVPAGATMTRRVRLPAIEDGVRFVINYEDQWGPIATPHSFPAPTQD